MPATADSVAGIVLHRFNRTLLQPAARQLHLGTVANIVEASLAVEKFLPP